MDKYIAEFKPEWRLISEEKPPISTKCLFLTRWGIACIGRWNPESELVIVEKAEWERLKQNRSINLKTRKKFVMRATSRGSRNLPYDYSRCLGTNCEMKSQCSRFTQLERDKLDVRLQTDNRLLSYFDPLVSGGNCSSLLLEE